jgi:hypothetical protein
MVEWTVNQFDRWMTGLTARLVTLLPDERVKAFTVLYRRTSQLSFTDERPDAGSTFAQARSGTSSCFLFGGWISRAMNCGGSQP